MLEEWKISGNSLCGTILGHGVGVAASDCIRSGNSRAGIPAARRVGAGMWQIGFCGAGATTPLLVLPVIFTRSAGAGYPPAVVRDCHDCLVVDHGADWHAGACQGVLLNGIE